MEKVHDAQTIERNKNKWSSSWSSYVTYLVRLNCGAKSGSGRRHPAGRSTGQHQTLPHQPPPGWSHLSVSPFRPFWQAARRLTGFCPLSWKMWLCIVSLTEYQRTFHDAIDIIFEQLGQLQGMHLMKGKNEICHFLKNDSLTITVTITIISLNWDSPLKGNFKLLLIDCLIFAVLSAYLQRMTNWPRLSTWHSSKHLRKRNIIYLQRKEWNGLSW